MPEQTAKNPWSYFAGGIAAGLVFTVLVFVIAFVAWIQPTFDKQSEVLTQVSQQRDACNQAQLVDQAMKTQAAADAERAKQQGITVTLPVPR
jgi:hypothetical protein